MEIAKIIADVSLGVIAISIAAIVALITHRQASTEKLRLRHELFDRRYEIYKTTQRFLSQVMQEAEFPGRQYAELVDAYQKSQFLFGEEIYQYLDEIRGKSLKLKNKDVSISSEALEWLTDQLPLLIPKFSPYMKFDV